MIRFYCCFYQAVKGNFGKSEIERRPRPSLSLGFLSFAGEPQRFQPLAVFVKSLLHTLVLCHGFGSLNFPE